MAGASSVPYARPIGQLSPFSKNTETNMFCSHIALECRHHERGMMGAVEEK